MPEEQRVANNSQTYVADADTFQFETLQQENGQATVIRFRLEDPRYHAGDVLVVLSGSEIHFHGMIGQLSDGWAVASDTKHARLESKSALRCDEILCSDESIETLALLAFEARYPARE